MIYICHQRPPFLVTIRLEQLYCNKKSAFFGITFDAHPHSGWFICLERFAFSTGLIALQLNAISSGTAAESLYKDGWYDFSNNALKTSWLQFANALVQGHIVISDLYSNTQVMTGEVAGGMGSSASILYYNDTVTYPDNTTEPMDLQIRPMPRAAGGKMLASQAGVGLCALKTTAQKQEAISVFAHWLTDSDRNLAFAAQTGYMPVT